MALSLLTLKTKMKECFYEHMLYINRKIIEQRATNNIDIRSERFSDRVIVRINWSPIFGHFPRNFDAFLCTLGGFLVEFKHYIIKTTSVPTPFTPKELITCNRLSMRSLHSGEKVKLQLVYHIQYTKNSVYWIWYTEQIGVKNLYSFNRWI